jgi:hypothetical protein
VEGASKEFSVKPEQPTETREQQESRGVFQGMQRGQTFLVGKKMASFVWLLARDLPKNACQMTRITVNPMARSVSAFSVHNSVKVPWPKASARSGPLTVDFGFPTCKWPFICCFGILIFCPVCLHTIGIGILCGACGGWAEEMSDGKEELEAVWSVCK